ncbi:hypothetical protein MBLNU457_g1048t1 [Dothideomycetes sp. NU457]
MAPSLLTIPQELRNEVYSYLPEITTVRLQSSALRVEGQGAVDCIRNAVSTPALALVNRQLRSEIGGSLRRHVEICVEDPDDTHKLNHWLSLLPASMIGRVETITLRFNMPGAKRIPVNFMGSTTATLDKIELVLTTAPSCTINVEPGTEHKNIRALLLHDPRCCRTEEKRITKRLKKLPHHSSGHRHIFAAGPFSNIISGFFYTMREGLPNFLPKAALQHQRQLNFDLYAAALKRRRERLAEQAEHTTG